MTITRPGETPSFYEYPINYALSSSVITPDKWPESVKEMDPTPIIIPPYQRKIVWKKNEVRDLINSNSMLFGTVILAHEGNDPLILLDGVQRFATATALLNYLYPLVLSPTPSKIELADAFKLISAHVASFEPIFTHNDNMLRNYTRKGIASSYDELYKNVGSVVDDELENDPIEFAKKMKILFINKQIAIDIYHGFKTRRELTHTFININSTGIDLSEVDLLRSEIVQQADATGWKEEDIDEVENRFTEIFQSGRIKGAKVLGKNLYDAWEHDEYKVFKNWDSLERSDIDNLLNFIEDISSAAEKENDQGEKVNPYLSEIFACGDLPFSITVWYFYKYVHLEGKIPDFLGGDFDTMASRHTLLRAFYRRVIDGTIGRTGPIVSNFIEEKNDPIIKSIPALANKINIDSGAGSLDSEPNHGWLFQNLRKAGTNRSKRIFNACLLPPREDSGKEFRPLEYGTKNNQWTIDHLVPKVKTVKTEMGGEDMDTITNMSPLPSDLNKKAKDFPCSQKLKPGELYSLAKGKHVFIDWLISEHYDQFSQVLSEEDDKQALDSQLCLVVNAEHDVGDNRVEKICEILKTKI